MANDIIGAIKDYLAADAGVAALAATRIYAMRLPAEAVRAAADVFHPPKTLVVRASGAASASRMINPVTTLDIDTVCYGESDYEADRLRRAVWDAMRAMNRAVVSGVLLHGAEALTGAVPIVDADVDWPAIRQTYGVLAETRAMA